MLASVRGLVKTILDRKWCDVKTAYIMSYYENHSCDHLLCCRYKCLPGATRAHPAGGDPARARPDGGPDMGDAGTVRDERGMTIDRAVPDAACGVALRVAGVTHQSAMKVACQVGEGP